MTYVSDLRKFRKNSYLIDIRTLILLINFLKLKKKILEIMRYYFNTKFLEKVSIFIIFFLRTQNKFAYENK